MFDHSIKVPRLYKVAAKITSDVKNGKGSIKQLVYETNHRNIKGIYALIVHFFQNSDSIERLLKKSKLLKKEPRLDEWLAKILITELLWGKKRLSGQSKPVQTILAYEQIFKAHLSDISDSNSMYVDQVLAKKPRYVRINTLKISINEVVEGFRDEGWNLRHYTGDYLDFLETISHLGPEEFMVDLHIPYLLIFPPRTQFYNHSAYKNSDIMLQDKASCLAIHILNPEPGSIVLDMCAAPGMKTTQCAAVLENKGLIYAAEMENRRYGVLNNIIEMAGATCVTALNVDALTLTSENCPKVKYILVDPSCSGSGLVDRVEIGQQTMDQTGSRVRKLAGFQIKLLRHALTKFPDAKRVVYSTCSIFPEENEDVVRQVLETCTTYKLIPADKFISKKWRNFGSSEFGEIGNYCLYAKPDIDLTGGFFIAVFKRLEKGETNPFLNRNIFASRYSKEVKTEINFKESQVIEHTKKRKKKKSEQTHNVLTEESKDEGTNSKIEKKTKPRIFSDMDQNSNTYSNADGTLLQKQIKEHKCKRNVVENVSEAIDQQLEDSSVEVYKKKTKKKEEGKYLDEEEQNVKFNVASQNIFCQVRKGNTTDKRTGKINKKTKNKSETVAQTYEQYCDTKKHNITSKRKKNDKQNIKTSIEADDLVDVRGRKHNNNEESIVKKKKHKSEDIEQIKSPLLGSIHPREHKYASTEQNNVNAAKKKNKNNHKIKDGRNVNGDTEIGGSCNIDDHEFHSESSNKNTRKRKHKEKVKLHLPDGSGNDKKTKNNIEEDNIASKKAKEDSCLHRNKQNIKQSLMKDNN